MSAIKRLNITVFLRSGLIFSALIMGAMAKASDFNAEKVMKEMKPDEQFAYLAGIIEGLAVARYHKDAKNKEGMGCIYDWFYKDKQNKQVIMESFEKYPAYPPGSIIDVLVKRKCGE